MIRPGLGPGVDEQKVRRWTSGRGVTGAGAADHAEDPHRNPVDSDKVTLMSPATLLGRPDGITCRLSQ